MWMFVMSLVFSCWCNNCVCLIVVKAVSMSFYAEDDVLMVCSYVLIEFLGMEFSGCNVLLSVWIVVLRLFLRCLEYDLMYICNFCVIMKFRRWLRSVKFTFSTVDVSSENVWMFIIFEFLVLNYLLCGEMYWVVLGLVCFISLCNSCFMKFFDFLLSVG